MTIWPQAMETYSIRLANGTWVYFDSRKDFEAAWAELILQDAHRELDKQNTHRAALDAELAERARMWGMLDV